MKRREENTLWNAADTIEKWVLFITTGAVALLMFLVAVVRFLDVAIVGYEEIVILLALWMYFIGSAHTSRKKSHMAADFLDPLFKTPKQKALMALFRRFATVLLNGILFYWAFQYLHWQWSIKAVSSFLHLPLILNYLGITVGLFLILLYECVYLYDNIKDCYVIFSKKEVMSKVREGGAEV